MTWDEAYDLLRSLPPGTRIPKPGSDRRYEIKGWVSVNGEERIAYTVANKAIPISWLRKSLGELSRTGRLESAWFRRAFYKGKDLGGCNFTTVGGLFQLIGIAKYSRPGVYVAAP